MRRGFAPEEVEGAERASARHSTSWIYSGSSRPRVSGATSRISSPTQNRPDIATTAQRSPSRRPDRAANEQDDRPQHTSQVEQLEPVARSLVGKSSGK